MNSTPPTLRWGILGCGGIARKFVHSARATGCAEIMAVGARSDDRADALAREFDIPVACDRYESLVKRADIDAVYIANTHNFHHESALLALSHGKHVLSEKPLAINAKEVRAMIDAAKENDCFLMEGMWTRFLPAVLRLREWIAAGRIGEVQQIEVSFGHRAEHDPSGRMLNPELAGGALLDLGIYPLAFASMLADGAAPLSMQGIAKIGETGVDVDDAMLLQYPNGLTAVLRCAMTCNLPNEVNILGTAGSIRVPPVFIGTSCVELRTESEEIRQHFPYRLKEGFQYEIVHVTDRIAAGAKESDIMPLTESLILAETMDAFRAQWGLRYPGE